jgi:hypothetical protein
MVRFVVFLRKKTATARTGDFTYSDPASSQQQQKQAAGQSTGVYCKASRTAWSDVVPLALTFSRFGEAGVRKNELITQRLHKPVPLGIV